MVERMVNLEEAAAVLRFHPEALRQMVVAGRVPARKMGRRWLMTVDELRAVSERGPAPVGGRWVSEPVEVAA